MSEDTKPLIVLNLKIYLSSTGEDAEDPQEVFRKLIGIE